MQISVECKKQSEKTKTIKSSVNFYEVTLNTPKKASSNVQEF